MNSNITIILVVVAVVAFVWYLYNSLIVTKMRVSEAFSQIDVQLKRRTNLIPNLVETVKGYAKHEKELFEKVTKERANLVSAKSLEQKAKINNQLTETFKSIFAVAEAYPALRASENFQQLQEELSDTENKIQAARRFYNTNVLELNTKIEQFPSNIVASMFGFAKATFFELTSSGEREPVKVAF